jgi:hypothetical protein
MVILWFGEHAFNLSSSVEQTILTRGPLIFFDLLQNSAVILDNHFVNMLGCLYRIRLLIDPL